MDRAAAIEEMEQARNSFRQLLNDASSASLRRRSNGTRWTNRQLLFHMLFGYLIVRTLLPLPVPSGDGRTAGAAGSPPRSMPAGVRST